MALRTNNVHESVIDCRKSIFNETTMISRQVHRLLLQVLWFLLVMGKSHHWCKSRISMEFRTERKQQMKNSIG
ncbi:unnamed protein product [Absidia cylindrospora]